MANHISNKGIRTANFGLIRQVFRFAVDGSGDPINVGTTGSPVYQAGANFVLSVTHTSPGVYTIQLNKNYPVRVVTVRADVATPAVTDDFRRAGYRAGSYSASAGTFVIQVAAPTADNDMSQVAADPIENSEVLVEVNYVEQTVGIGN